MAFGLGPRATRVYESLRGSIAGGELPPGTKLPAHTELLYYPDVFGHSDGGQFTVK